LSGDVEGSQDLKLSNNSFWPKCHFAFSALTLLIGQQEGHPTLWRYLYKSVYYYYYCCFIVKRLSGEVLAWLYV